jgi:hypothetical protein
MKDDSKTSIDKQLNCVDYNNDGTKLAVCGSEKIVILNFKRRFAFGMRLNESKMSNSERRIPSHLRGRPSACIASNSTRILKILIFYIQLAGTRAFPFGICE